MSPLRRMAPPADLLIAALFFFFFFFLYNCTFWGRSVRSEVAFLRNELASMSLLPLEFCTVRVEILLCSFQGRWVSYPPARQCFTAQLMCHSEANSSSVVQWQSWSPGDEFWSCICFQMFTIKWRDKTVGGEVISPSSLLQIVSYSTHSCTCGGLLYLHRLDEFAENSNCSNVISKYVHLCLHIKGALCSFGERKSNTKKLKDLFDP